MKIKSGKNNFAGNDIVCYCSNVTEGQIIAAVKNGAKTLQSIKEITGACTGCTCVELNPKRRCCAGDIIKILDGFKD